MRELCAQARTIFVVSHGLQSLQALCNEIIWMHDGEVALRGDPDEVIDTYRRFLKIGDKDIALEED
jgi:teichoic acid transport system ATP-binding protein